MISDNDRGLDVVILWLTVFNDVMSCRRAIHFVLKIGKRNEAVGFYKNVLGMKVYNPIQSNEYNGSRPRPLFPSLSKNLKYKNTNKL